MTNTNYKWIILWFVGRTFQMQKLREKLKKIVKMILIQN